MRRSLTSTVCVRECCLFHKAKKARTCECECECTSLHLNELAFSDTGVLITQHSANLAHLSTLSTQSTLDLIETQHSDF